MNFWVFLIVVTVSSFGYAADDVSACRENLNKKNLESIMRNLEPKSTNYKCDESTVAEIKDELDNLKDLNKEELNEFKEKVSPKLIEICKVSEAIHKQFNIDAKETINTLIKKSTPDKWDFKIYYADTINLIKLQNLKQQELLEKIYQSLRFRKTAEHVSQTLVTMQLINGQSIQAISNTYQLYVGTLNLCNLQAPQKQQPENERDRKNPAPNYKLI